MGRGAAPRRVSNASAQGGMLTLKAGAPQRFQQGPGLTLWLRGCCGEAGSPQPGAPGGFMNQMGHRLFDLEQVT